jgi:hypothetical protein
VVVLDERAELRQLDTLRPVVDRLLVRPARDCEAGPQRVDLGLRDVDRERADRCGVRRLLRRRNDMVASWSLRVEAPRNSSTAASSNEGEFVTSMTSAAQRDTGGGGSSGSLRRPVGRSSQPQATHPRSNGTRCRTWSLRLGMGGIVPIRDCGLVAGFVHCCGRGLAVGFGLPFCERSRAWRSSVVGSRVVGVRQGPGSCLRVSIWWMTSRC